MIQAPINPSDYVFRMGLYPVDKPLPHIPGFEGFGEVVAVGDKKDEHLLHQKGNCHFLGHFGSYSSYSVAQVESFFPIKKEIKQNPFLLNPATVIAMFYLMRKIDAKAFGQSGASSCVGRELLLLNKYKYKMKNVNIHRNDIYNESLAELGSSQTLNQNDPEFEAKLKASMHENKVQAFFDCVGGKVASQIFENLPRNSTLFLYGLLCGKQELTINNGKLIFHNRFLRGFHVFADFLNKENLHDFQDELDIINEHFHEVGFQDEKFTLQQNNEATDFYIKKSSIRVIFEFPGTKKE